MSFRPTLPLASHRLIVPFLVEAGEEEDKIVLLAEKFARVSASSAIFSSHYAIKRCEQTQLIPQFLHLFAPAMKILRLWLFKHVGQSVAATADKNLQLRGPPVSRPCLSSASGRHVLQCGELSDYLVLPAGSSRRKAVRFECKQTFDALENFPERLSH